MPTLPMTEDHLVIRTDFSDPSAWAAVQADLAQKWGEEFAIYVEIIETRPTTGSARNSS